jgi:hypothetical protein
MADLIEKELQSFSEPTEVNFILLLNMFNTVLVTAIIVLFFLPLSMGLLSGLTKFKGYMMNFVPI